jgi:hypothetical protein
MDALFSRMAALWARLKAGPLGAPIERLQTRWRRATGTFRQRWRRGTAPVRPAVDRASSAAHRAAEATRPGRSPILYRDGMITLDGEGIVISAYYMPFGRHRIPYHRIREVREHALTGGRGFRLHGFAWPRYWLHRDARRSDRSVGLELRTDTLLWPVLTPADVDAVKEILTRQIAAHRARGGS